MIHSALSAFAPPAKTARDPVFALPRGIIPSDQRRRPARFKARAGHKMPAGTPAGP